MTVTVKEENDKKVDKPTLNIARRLFIDFELDEERKTQEDERMEKQYLNDQETEDNPALKSKTRMG